MYNLNEAQRLYYQSRTLNLSGSELLGDYGRVSQVCNGVGALWMGKTLCAVVTKINPSLEPAAAIHDLRYEQGGTMFERKLADQEFLANGKVISGKLPWYSLRRYYISIKLYKYYALLRIFGAKAWGGIK